MQDTDLFLSLAEIAGVFVGFGALISARSHGASDSHEVAFIRSVVWIGTWVVVAALAPVIISRYGSAGREAWVACSIVALVLFSGLWIASFRSPEHRAEMAGYTRAQIVGYTILVGILVVPAYAALVLVVLGLFSDVEPALYFTAVVLGLFLGALALLGHVYWRERPRGPEAAGDPS